MGPHKTGSTSLQFALQTYKKALRRDNYHLPPPLKGKFEKKVKNVANLAFELRQINASILQNTFGSALSVFEQWATTQSVLSDIIVSAEAFDKKSTNISILASILSNYQTTVVVGYRPFYDYIASIRRELSGNAHQQLKFTDWLTNYTLSEYGAMFTPVVALRFAEYFEDVRILPLRKSYFEDFFCLIAKANHACNQIRIKPPNKKNVRKTKDTVLCAEKECISEEIRANLGQMSIDFALETVRFPQVLRHSHFAPNVSLLIAEFKRRDFCSCVD